MEIEFWLGGSSPYTSNKQEWIYINDTMQKHSKYKYTYDQNTHTIFKTPTHYKTHTYTNTNTHTHTLQNKLKQPQYKTHTK